MSTLIHVGMWISTAIGVVFLLAALVGRAPKQLALGLAAVAELAVLIAVVADVVMLIGGQQTPELITHIGYLLTVPFMIPLGVALTYRKIDRWGLIIMGVACLIAAVLVLRQIQTLGVIGG